MVEVAGDSFYVDDFILFQHSQYGLTCGKVVKFFTMVNKSLLSLLYNSLHRKVIADHLHQYTVCQHYHSIRLVNWI